MKTMHEQELTKALEFIKSRHNGEIPYSYGPMECVKLMIYYASQFREPSTEQSGLNEVYNLLAVLHGDGGHYREKHGLVKATNDAQELLHTKWIIKESEESGGTEQDEFAMKFLEYASGLSVSNYKSGGNWYLSDGRIVKTADILKQFKEESKP